MFQLIFQPVPGLKHPADEENAGGEKKGNHEEAQGQPDVGRFIKAPAEAADQIHDGVKQRNLLPEGGEHVDGVKTTAQKRKRGDDENRNDLQLFKPVGPDADDKAKEAEGD